MKPFMKVGSFLLAAVMLCSALFVAGCSPISLEKEWSYKANGQELPIGVYIYSLKTAYQQAESYAKELKDYDSTKNTWLSMKITDDDKNKKVAKDWIIDKAKEMCLSYLVVDEMIKSEKIDFSGATKDSADDQAKTYWNVGQYADYGYVMPMKDDFEPYGVSLESFSYCMIEYSVKCQELFDKLYNEGGSKFVSDEELTKYFTKEYTSYKYLPVNLYTASTDEAGEQTNVAMSDKEIKKITKEIDGYAKDINKGKSYEDAVKAYMKANNVESDPTTANSEILDDSSMGDELKKAIGKLKKNEASTLKVGTGESAVYYLIYKGDIKDDVKDYIQNAEKRPSVLQSMKSEEFKDDIAKAAKELKAEANTSVIDRYNPEMFFVPVEPTTAENAESSNSKSE